MVFTDVHCTFNTASQEMCKHPPKVSKTLAEYNTLTEGSVVKYSCPTRYGLVGDQKLTCNKGKWIGVVPSCKGMFTIIFIECPCVWSTHCGMLYPCEKVLPTNEYMIKVSSDADSEATVYAINSVHF